MKNLKYFKICFLFSLVAMLQIRFVNAQNLVPNPSFEEYSECPNEPAQTYFLNYWSININTADYFNKCSSSEYVSIPSNSFGYQYPKDTNCSAYAGFWAFRSVSLGYQEYIGTKLIEPLIEGERYFMSFSVVLANDLPTNNCAVNKLGVLFTNYDYGNSIINYPELMTNNFAHFYAEEIINDVANWTTVNGSFIADSSYQYLIIGKFFNNENTSMICNESSYSDRSYYYLDDVCVSTDSAFCWDYVYDCNSSNKDEIVYNTEFTLFPNPANDHVFVQMENDMFQIVKSIELYTLQGNNVTDKVEILNNENCGYTIKRNNLNEGIYILKIHTFNKPYYTKLIFN